MQFEKTKKFRKENKNEKIFSHPNFYQVQGIRNMNAFRLQVLQGIVAGVESYSLQLQVRRNTQISHTGVMHT